MARWQSIAESAAKQSKRNIIPTVSSVVSFKEMLNTIKLIRTSKYCLGLLKINYVNNPQLQTERKGHENDK